MHLDTPERRKVEHAVMIFHQQWFPRAKRRLRKTDAQLLFFWIACYITALALLIAALVNEALPPDMAAGSIIATVFVFIGLMWLSCRRHQKKIRTLTAENQPEKWMEEIEELRAGCEERQLFLRLIAAMNRGKGVGNLSLEAIHSPNLCRLSFVWKLYDYILADYLASR